ncbi:hypothetical protein M8494_12890 [Serratia ureilytica]
MIPRNSQAQSLPHRLRSAPRAERRSANLRSDAHLTGAEGTLAFITRRGWTSRRCRKCVAWSTW